VFVTNFECAEISIVVSVVVVIAIVVPVIILILLVSAGLLKPIIVHALSNRGYGMQTFHMNHC